MHVADKFVHIPRCALAALTLQLISTDSLPSSKIYPELHVAVALLPTFVSILWMVPFSMLGGGPQSIAAEHRWITWGKDILDYMDNVNAVI